MTDITNMPENLQEAVKRYLDEHDEARVIGANKTNHFDFVYIEYGNMFVVLNVMTVNGEVFDVRMDSMTSGRIQDIIEASPVWFPKPDPLDGVMGVDEAAEQWGVTPGHVKNLCASHRVRARKIGGAWVLDRNQTAPSGYSPKECGECGNWFEPAHSAQKYCDTCRNKVTV